MYTWKVEARLLNSSQEKKYSILASISILLKINKAKKNISTNDIIGNDEAFNTMDSDIITINNEINNYVNSSMLVNSNENQICF